jgi:hypothetical protein
MLLKMSRAGQLQKLASFLENQGWASTFGRQVGPYCQHFIHMTSVPGNCRASTLISDSTSLMLLFVCFPLPPTIKIHPISVHVSIPKMTTSIPVPTII